MTGSADIFGGGGLIITVDENQDLAINSLGVAVKADGQAVSDTLLDKERCGYDHDRVRHLSGSEASSAGISNCIAQMSTLLDENDPFLLFYSGHGGHFQDGVVLFPFDAELSSKDGLLSSASLSKDLNKIRSRRKLIVVDACHSGGLNLSGGIAKGPKSLSRSLLDTLSSGSGMVTIASSRQSEESFIQQGDGLSLFTKHFVGGLKGGGGHDPDGFVRVFDLFNFVAESVRREEPRQSPVYAAYEQDINFPVAYCAAVEKRIDVPDPTTVSSSHYDNQRKTTLIETLCQLYPLGPTDQEIWQRAGGDVSRLQLSGSGRTAWIRAIGEILRGASVSTSELVQAASEDYPLNRKLLQILEEERTNIV